MSSFTTSAILKMLPNREFEVYEEYIYHVGEKNSDEFINVPKGFVTDLASIPRLFWMIMPPHDTYGKAAILHDYMYKAGFDKTYSDTTFKEALQVLNIKTWKIWLLYNGVKLFGKR